MSTQASDHAPLKELELIILLCLAEEPLHGYALLDRVGYHSSGFVKPGPTSLYRAVAQLVDNGLITAAPAPAESNDPRRRYYRQTARGRAILRAELRRLDDLVARARDLGISFDGASR